MKRLLIIAIIVATAISAGAQRITRSYDNVPLPKALAELNDMQSDYAVSFIYDDLRDFTVTADIRRADAVEAVRQMIGLNNIKVNIVDKTILVECGEIGHRLKGTIIDNNGNPIEFANVQLLSPKDSTYITGGVSNESGRFVIPCSRDMAIMRVSYIGMKTLTRMVNMTDIGTIKMQADEFALKEVKVKGQMPKTQLKDGAMITNVAGTILERAGTAEQLLNRIPNVMAKDNKVEVFGRGIPEIYINGRRMREQGELTRLSSEDIKRVEVITNPGARYSASTTSVVRITTKPKVGDGFSVYSQSRLAREESGLWSGLESLSLNYRKNGFDLGGSLYYNQTSERDDKDLTNYTFLEKTWTNKLAIRQRYDSKDFYAKLRASYAIDEKNSIGASFSYDRYPEGSGAGSTNAMLYENDALSDHTLSPYEGNDLKTYLNGNAYYVGKIGNIGIDFNTDWYYGKSDRWMNTEDVNTTVNTETTTRNRLLASKLVLTAPLLGGELSLGGEYSHSKRTTQYNVMPKDIIDDDDSRISEGMTSAFVEYSHTFGKLSLNAGVRYEYVDFNYYDHGVRVAEQSRTFSDLFPSMSLTLPVGKTQMMLTYATDVTRPSYWLLRSSTIYGNQYTYDKGNPFLLPQVRSNVGYTLSYKWLTYSATFSHMKRPIMVSTEMYKDKPETTLLSYVNGDSYNLFFTSVSFSPKIGIWSPMLMLGVMKQWMDLTTFDGHSINNPKGTFRFNNTLETKLCDITLSMIAQTEGGDMNEYFRDGYFNADLTLRRSFMNKRLSVQLDINRLLHPVNRTVRDYNGGICAGDFKSIDYRLVALTVRYNLNTTRSKYKGTGAGQSQKARM